MLSSVHTQASRTPERPQLTPANTPAGGRNLWGNTDSSRKGFNTPSYNDGAIEVVGLRNGWHTGMVLGSHGSLVHAKRLAQATAVRMELRVEPAPADGQPGVAYLQVRCWSAAACCWCVLLVCAAGACC